MPAATALKVLVVDDQLTIRSLVRSGLHQMGVTDIMEAVGSPNISDFFPAIAPADLQGWRRRLAALFARLHRIFDEEIDGRLRGREAGEPKKNDFLDLLLDAAEYDDNTAGLDRDTLRSLFTVSRRDFSTAV